MSGSITLAQVAERTAVLAVACSRCDRAGQYSLTTLIERYGAREPIPLLLQILSSDCPKRQQSIHAYDLCGMHCPELSGLFRVQPKDSPR